jgi:hypothetical protein
MGGRSRTLLAWSLWLGTFACLIGRLVVTLAVTRPLTTDVLADGAFEGAIWLLFATVGLVLTLPLLLLPDGRLRSPRWRAVLAVVVVGTAMNVVGWWLSPGPMTQTLRPVAKPFSLDGWAGTAAIVVTWIGFGITFATIPAAAPCVVLRFRASTGAERQQLRWVAAGPPVPWSGRCC